LHNDFQYNYQNGTQTSIADRSIRRQLRQAIHDRDVDGIRKLVESGVDVNALLSDVFCNTALTCAVKCGYLEVVEALLEFPRCRLGALNRRKHSALDEGIRAWLRQQTSDDSGESGSDTRHQRGRTFRILRRLLEAGASTSSVAFLDSLVGKALSRTDGFHLVAKLTNVVCESGCAHIKGVLIGVLLAHFGTETLLTNLIVNNAVLPRHSQLDALMVLAAEICLNNLVVMIRAYADPGTLYSLTRLVASGLHWAESCWGEYYRILRMLTVAGAVIPMTVLNYLYGRHAEAYRWITEYNSSPKSLRHSSRDVIRKLLRGNVVAGLRALDEIPKFLKRYVMLADML